MTSLSILNEKQREAVVSESKRTLVIAGAGSGKTKTLIQKVLYLISEKNVKPSNILAITFTKNAANEMIDRLIMADDLQADYEAYINNKTVSKEQKDAMRLNKKNNIPWIKNLTVRTFHSLCYTILRNSSSPDVFDSAFRLITDETYDEGAFTGQANIAPERSGEIMDKVLRKACSDISYLLKLKRYVLDYMVTQKHMHRQKGSSYENIKTYTTLRGEQVRSKSERDIADWFYRHQIDYRYEQEITIKDFTFTPDFYIPKANIFLEHISDMSYSMKNKEEQFKKAGLVCERTYEHMMHDTDRFNKEMERIVRGKVDLKVNSRVALNFNEEFKGYMDKIGEFINAVGRIRDLVKLEGIGFESLRHKSSRSQHERIRLFYELAIPLIKGYNDYCTDRSYLDFDDIIIKTIELFEQRPEVREQYARMFQYILVDEFQDVNNHQVRLLKLLLKPETQLFCVGDDWQSIYGFRGSEVKYIVNFQEHFENAHVIKLHVNYRSNQAIVGASNYVISHNTLRVDKEVIAFRNTPSLIQIFRAKNIEQDGVTYLVDKVRQLQKEGLSGEDILILYRRSNMFYRSYKMAIREAGIQVSARTIHASKGLEARAVFIIGLTDGQGGFPDIWAADALSKIVKEVKYDMQLEEERRLFYVALTRAKDELYLITQLGNESKFIDEIPKDFYHMKTGQFRDVLQPISKCKGCGAETREFYNYCPNCGIKLVNRVM